jgi:hypothetical protein
VGLQLEPDTVVACAPTLPLDTPRSQEERSLDFQWYVLYNLHLENSQMMIALLCPVHSSSRPIEIEGGIHDMVRALQNADHLKKYPIETLEVVDLETPIGTFSIYCDEDGLTNFNKENAFDIYGPFIILGVPDEDGEDTGLEPSQVEYLQSYLQSYLAKK